MRRRSPIWLATEPVGVAHARSHLVAPWTACGIPAIDQRYAWPTRSRCAVCEAVIARVKEVATA